MNIHFNTLVKNEEVLLKKILPIWVEYPIDKFIFLNDNSQDNTEEVIRQFIPKDRLNIINSNSKNFNEAKYRKLMLDYSKECGADFVLAIDSDELLSANLAKELKEFIKYYNNVNILLYWYNAVENSITKTRYDLAYRNAFHQFIIPIKYSEDFNLINAQYHSSWRTPKINLKETYAINKFGIIHLQALNIRHYALKQLWYKHYEYVNYKFQEDLINLRYDKNINYLNFESVLTPEEIYKDIDFQHQVFDQLADAKGYKDFILKNLNRKLVTFGEEYLI